MDNTLKPIYFRVGCDIYNVSHITHWWIEKTLRVNCDNLPYGVVKCTFSTPSRDIDFSFGGNNILLTECVQIIASIYFLLELNKSFTWEEATHGIIQR